MIHSRKNARRGTVSLVALCCVAVMGIALASYLAVASSARKLSNLSSRSGLSQQLAEVGLEEGLRAFNANDWGDWSSIPANMTTSGAWTLDTTNHRASRTINFGAGKLGQGVTAAVKIRIDNYDADQLNATWSSSANYRINDLVGYSGTWYRCVKAHSNQTPSGMNNLTYWAPAPVPWKWQPNTAYSLDDIVNNSGAWYRCTTAHTSTGTPPPNSNWTLINSITAWSGLVSYVNGDIVNFNSTVTWYRWNGSSWLTVPGMSWQWKSGTTYTFNDLVYYYTGTTYNWYRCKTASISSSTAPNSDATNWENALSGSMYGWSSSSINYNIGDVVYYSTTSQMYRCIRAHTSSGSITPADTNYWANSPRLSAVWDSGRQYSQNDTVIYNGVWYLSLQSSNTNQNPATATTYWVGANTATTSYQWNATTTYAAGNYKCYGGVWYKCLAASTGYSPNNTTYWTASWANGWGLTTGAPVIYAEATVTLSDATTADTQLRAAIARSPLFPNAVAATTTINASSGGTVDSYDGNSGIAYASQVGTATNFSAVVAAGQTSGTATTLGSVAVSGYLAAPSSSSSPYAPLYSSGGTVKGFTSPATPNIDLTRLSRSPYIPQFDALPRGGLTAAFGAANFSKGSPLILSNTINIGSPGSAAPTRYYYNSGLTIGDATVNFLNINGPVILYINGDLTITASGSTGRATIATTGSAEIHVAGSLKVDVGGEGFNNLTLDPKKLLLICDTASSASQFYSDGSYPLYGCLYMPNTTNASGFYNDNGSVQIYGAVSAKKITYSGANMNIHYDTSLRYATFDGVDQPFAVTEWRQLPIGERATMP